MEYFNIISNIIASISSIIVVIIAIIALNTWKREFVGKKKIDLACEIMEKACNIQDIIKQIRNPFCFSAETNKILEDLQDKNTNDSKIPINENQLHYLIPIYRMEKCREDIDNFLKLKNKAQLYWNNNILNLFNEINKMLIKISISSKNLYRGHIKEQEVFNKYEKDIWDMGEEDIINLKIKNIINEFRLNLEPLYKDRLDSWKKIK